MDSNILLRLYQRNDPLHPVVRHALTALWSQGNQFYYTSQIVGEFWNVCTRPGTARGGYGLPLSETNRRVRLIERLYQFLPDSAAVHAEWRRRLVAHAVMGVQVHDTRLVAVRNLHGISHLLTFNVSDFARFPGITAQHPQSV